MTGPTKIICPKCGEEIDVSEALYGEIETRIKSEYENKIQQTENELRIKLEEVNKQKLEIEKEKGNFDVKLKDEINKKFKEEKPILEKSLRGIIENENKDAMNLLTEELKQKSEQLKEFNRAKIEIEKLKREKDEVRDQVALEKEKEFSEKLKEEKADILKNSEESFHFKIKEKDKLIDDLKVQIEEVKRKAEQGSVQTQGKIQEIELENMLKNLFVYDDIIPIKTGQKGADILQTVMTHKGDLCGKIYYESKRTIKFENSWINKLLQDNSSIKADILVIVTQTMPPKKETFHFENGVWICTFWEVEPLASVFRQWLLNIHAVSVTQQGKVTKTEMLYNYLTGSEFAFQFNSLVEGFRKLQESHFKEKVHTQKVWAEKEKQINIILENVMHFYGSIKGIAGSSIPDYDYLEEEENKLLE